MKNNCMDQARYKTDVKMEKLRLNLQQNGTSDSCINSVETIHVVLNTVLLFFSFPATFIVIEKLLKKIYKTRSFSSAEIFLLHTNFTNVSLFIFNFLLFLDVMNVHNFSLVLYMVLFSPTLTARPIFLLSICGIFYLAIVHPVTYMTAKTWHHWEWLVITLGWLYALAINVAIGIYEINIFQQLFSVFFYNSNLPSMFLNMATLRALSSSGPGKGGQTLNPQKRKAFWIILSILVVLLLYYIPGVYYISYPHSAPKDQQRFLCYEGGLMILVAQFSEFAMPVIFLYSVRKLSV